MLSCLAVGAGGFFGSVARYLLGMIPVPTIAVNVIGSFLIGMISAYALKDAQFDPLLLLFLKVGICGGFTTFSTFSLESVELMKNGAYIPAVFYMTFSVIICIVATMLGQTLVK